MMDGESGNSDTMQPWQTSPIQVRRQYDATFQRETVANWLSSGKSADAVALELGLSANRLYAWRNLQAPAAAEATAATMPPGQAYRAPSNWIWFTGVPSPPSSKPVPPASTTSRRSTVANACTAPLIACPHPHSNSSTRNQRADFTVPFFGTSPVCSCVGAASCWPRRLAQGQIYAAAMRTRRCTRASKKWPVSRICILESYSRFRDRARQGRFSLHHYAGVQSPAAMARLGRPPRPLAAAAQSVPASPAVQTGL
jgi:transposase-like protein